MLLPFFMSDEYEFDSRFPTSREIEKEVSEILKKSKNCKECQPNFSLKDELMSSLDDDDFLRSFKPNDYDVQINKLYQNQKVKDNLEMDKKTEERLEDQYELYEEYQDEHVDRVQQQIVRDNANGFWKYEEDETLKELQDYLSGTYRSHYTSQESKTQTLDLIESIGDAEPFCRSNAIKYLSRFGKKNGKSKLDILKAMHYCVLLYHFAGLHKKSTDNYETF